MSKKENKAAPKSEIVRKITPKTVMGNVREIAKEIKKEGDTVDLMTVYGRATGYVTGTSDFGDYVRFKGEFRAVNMITGDQFTAMNMLLPGAASDLLEVPLSGDEKVNDVEFAFKIGIKRDDSVAIGYIYTVEPLIEAKESDAIARLSASVLPQIGMNK